jgi:rhomboid protease GluP
LHLETLRGFAETGSAMQPEKLEFPSSRPLATQALLVVNIIIFALTYLYQQTSPVWITNPILRFGVMDYDQIVRGGEWYRLITAFFLHLDFAHMLFNGYALWVIGRDMESFYGRGRYLIIYFLSGLGGTLASWIIGRGASAGASGAIFGLIGAEVIFLYFHRGVADNRYIRLRLREIGIYMILSFGLGAVSAAYGQGVRIDNWGHLGGLIAGLIASAAVVPQYRVGTNAQGKAAVIDMRPFGKVIPFAILLTVVMIGIGIVAYNTLPR